MSDFEKWSQIPPFNPLNPIPTIQLTLFRKIYILVSAGEKEKRVKKVPKMRI
jgi:hypothetical protein